jgi:RNA polymerase-binding transcription factor DksA
MGSGRVQRRVELTPTSPAATRQAMSHGKASLGVPGALTPLQRLQLRDRLQELWRAQVEIISTAGVRFQLAVHNRGSDSSRAPVEDRLAAARVRLTELEAAMRRMDARRYGTCDRCHQPMTFDELLATPEKTSCAGNDSHEEEE